ncbi:hypothetical protein NPIL_921 [Nephila pilipes]|uniref:Uncharacterized protein n=1 Tax=Nephila pilipes TaxID=299642 RepID=A0A8X6MLE9_NEPPI|nr:hypothetical protein NPIL_921 [Nephila pilipes]
MSPLISTSITKASIRLSKTRTHQLLIFLIDNFSPELMQYRFKIEISVLPGEPIIIDLSRNVEVPDREPSIKPNQHLTVVQPGGTLIETHFRTMIWCRKPEKPRH